MQNLLLIFNIPNISLHICIFFMDKCHMFLACLSCINISYQFYNKPFIINTIINNSKFEVWIIIWFLIAKNTAAKIYGKFIIF